MIESLMDDLDYILLDQLHSIKKSKKAVKRIRQLTPDDPLVSLGEALIENRIKFFESMVSDKALLRKKHKRKKRKDIDILAKNPVYDWYKTIFMASTLGYRMFMGSVSSYMSYFKKGKT
jgi:hypothetical protein